MANAICYLNGQIVPCGEAFNGASSFLGFFFGFFIILWLIMMAVLVLIIVANWKIYQKAGKLGWAAIIPIYNLVVLLEIVKKPIWWIVLFFVPFANIIILIIITHNLSKVFGKDVGFTLGLIFLPFIFFPILGFGKASYIGDVPSTNATSPTTPTPTSTPSTTTSTGTV